MIRSCLPVFLALVIVGCSSSAPKSIANDSGTIGDSVVDNIASESDTFTAVSVGDYIVEIPSSWTNDKDFYYAGDVGTLPYIYVSFSDDYSIDDLVGDPDGFIDGSFSNFEDAKLTSGMSPVDYDYSSGYSYSFSATVQGYDTNNIFTFL